MVIIVLSAHRSFSGLPPRVCERSGGAQPLCVLRAFYILPYINKTASDSPESNLPTHCLMAWYRDLALARDPPQPATRAAVEVDVDVPELKLNPFNPKPGTFTTPPYLALWARCLIVPAPVVWCVVRRISRGA